VGKGDTQIICSRGNKIKEVVTASAIPPSTVAFDGGDSGCRESVLMHNRAEDRRGERNEKHLLMLVHSAP